MRIRSKTLVVSTCGTSLLTNETGKPLRDLLNATANDSEAELDTSERAKIDLHLESRQKDLVQASLDRARKLSAEFWILNKKVSLMSTVKVILNAAKNKIKDTILKSARRSAHLPPNQ